MNKTRVLPVGRRPYLIDFTNCSTWNNQVMNNFDYLSK